MHCGELHRFRDKVRPLGLNQQIALKKLGTGPSDDDRVHGRSFLVMYREGAKPKGTIMPCRGVRGATTTDANTKDEIQAATRQLLTLMIRVNGIESEDVACAIFTVTRDLNAEFPAFAARQLGWGDVPLLCSYEIDVPGSTPRCIRILANWNTSKRQREITHVYIKGAKNLRPDFSGAQSVDLEPVESWIADNWTSHESLTM